MTCRSRAPNDSARCAAQNAASEKLNDERGDKPLLVNRLRDGAEPGKRPPERVRGSFCILPPEIQVTVAWETMEKRELLAYRMAGRFFGNQPT